MQQYEAAAFLFRSQPGVDRTLPQPSLRSSHLEPARTWACQPHVRDRTLPARRGYIDWTTAAASKSSKQTNTYTSPQSAKMKSSPIESSWP